MERLLQLHDEDDDATSKAPPTPEVNDQQPYNDYHPLISSSAHLVTAGLQSEVSLTSNDLIFLIIFSFRCIF